MKKIKEAQQASQKDIDWCVLINRISTKLAQDRFVYDKAKAVIVDKWKDLPTIIKCFIADNKPTELQEDMLAFVNKLIVKKYTTLPKEEWNSFCKKRDNIAKEQNLFIHKDDLPSKYKQPRANSHFL